MQPLLTVSKLNKCFKARQVLTDISFEVYSGEILCLLGPNGAGKTTTINILSTTMHPDSGVVRYRGEPINKKPNLLKRNLGIVPQDLAIYEEISAAENVSFFASLYGLRGKELKENTQQALAFVGLAERQKDKPKTFSGGMKRRLNIACAIAHRPEVIIMDEPTVGIDPQSRNHILESIRRLRDDGTTIIYTSHYMEEVEEISSRIIIVDHGQIIATGTKEELKERLADEKMYEVSVENIGELRLNELYRIDGVTRVELTDNLLRVATLKGVENLDRIITALVTRGVKIHNMSSSFATLERVFLNLTGRTLRD